MSHRKIDKVQLQFAEQQFLGYTHAKRGYSLTSLIQSMGLSESEWEELRKYNLDFTESERNEIDEYFNQKP